jgi:hypothetical protein
MANQTQQANLPEAARALTLGLIDYAGLFPPASLPMPEAVENFARYLREPLAPMLGRFVCPASRLNEFTKAGQMLMPGTFATSGYPEMAGDGEPWRLSAIVPHDTATPLHESLEQIREFNHRHEDASQGLAIVDAIETPLKAVADVDALLDAVPEQLAIAMEVPVAQHPDIRGYIAALAGTGTAAKVRCGGVTADAMLPAQPIIAFMQACRTAGVPFKCTAGLHHALPGQYRLTYDANPPMGHMQGFVNTFIAAILIGARAIDEHTALDLMADADGAHFVLTDQHIGWKQHTIPVATATEQRARFALSYGSCSFEEPTGELAALLANHPATR